LAVHEHLAAERCHTFTDTAGTPWCVVEVDAHALPGTRGARCLLFFSAAAVRRVWWYPARWRELSPLALAALSLEP